MYAAQRLKTRPMACRLERGSSQSEGRRGSTAKRTARLTRREQQIVNLLLEGCDHAEIARQLRIAQRRVKAYFNRLFLRFWHYQWYQASQTRHLSVQEPPMFGRDFYGERCPTEREYRTAVTPLWKTPRSHDEKFLSCTSETVPGTLPNRNLVTVPLRAQHCCTPLETRENHLELKRVADLKIKICSARQRAKQCRGTND